jgi:hypothetical protein
MYKAYSDREKKASNQALIVSLGVLCEADVHSTFVRRLSHLSLTQNSLADFASHGAACGRGAWLCHFAEKC